ncbi:MAG: HipA domain-containing protein [Desulfuromusa sp.]|nr:HipA domain-containing protein [Desulfuromusa sp.]
MERYDRRQTQDGTMRLHQEDFCQALGVESSFKYEKGGGLALQLTLTYCAIGLMSCWLMLLNCCAGRCSIL